MSEATTRAALMTEHRDYIDGYAAGLADGRRIAPQPAVPVVSEDDLVACLISSGCVGTVKMSFESGPMSITRPSLNATKLARAILTLRPAVEPMTDEVRRSYQCLLAMNTPHGFGDRIGPFVKWLQDSGITAKAEGGA